MQEPLMLSPAQALADLSQHLRDIRSALVVGVRSSVLHFTEQGRAIDRYLFPHLVRYHAGQHLRDCLNSMEDEPEDVETVANNGLCTRSGRYRFRTLKAGSSGELPPPHSVTRKRFYAQEPELQLSLFDPPLTLEEQMDIELKTEPTVHLVVLWTVTADFELADQLHLIYPSVASSGKVRENWRVLVPCPEDRAQTALPGTAEDEWDDDLDIQPLLDEAKAAE